MIPILYEYDVTNPQGEGLGRLSDATACFVDAETTGLYDLEMQYPINSPMFPALQLSRVIGVRIDPVVSNLEPFDIYEISTPAEGSITVKARHISYRLLGQVVQPFTATSASDAITKLNANIIAGTKQTTFSFGLQLGDGISNPAKAYELAEPRAVRTVLAELADVYGGNVYYTGTSAYLQIGCAISRGASVIYGKNMATMNYNVDIGDRYTHVLGWYHHDAEYEDEPETAVTAYVLVEMAAVQQAEQRTMIADITQAVDDQAEEADTPDEPDLSPSNLTALTQQFITNNRDVISTPVITTELSHYEIGDQPVRLGDIVSVRHPNFLGDIGAMCTKYRYDVLGEQFETVTLGTPKGSIDSALACILSYLPRHSDDWWNYGARLGTGGGGGGNCDCMPIVVMDADDYYNLETVEENTIYMLPVAD